MNEESQSIIAEINSSLSLATKRQNGLFKMISFLEKCNSSLECTLLEQNCSFWIRTIFQIFENHPVSLHAKLAHYAFYLIIQISKSLSADLQRHISTTLIEKAVNLLISSSDLLAKNSLLCLNELISCYKTSCSQFRTKIENYVYTRLESDSDELIKWSGVCYAKLPYLHKNTNNTDVWYLYFKNMLFNAHSLLNELFEDYHAEKALSKQDSHELDQNESMNTSQKSELRSFSKFSKDSDNLEFYYKKSLKRFKACLSCLTNLLEPLSDRTCINVRANEVIEFLKRIFLFDFKKLESNCRFNQEATYLNDALNEMLISTFEFCAKFFINVNTNLIPQTMAINNILLNIGHSIASKNSVSLLASYYSCLNTWMMSLGSNSGFFKNSFTIIENLLKKIKPFEKNSLSIENSKSNNFRIKQKQKLATMFNLDKNSLNTFQVLGQNRLVTSAIECLRTYLKIFSFNLSYNQFEKIHSSIIDMILYVQYNINARKPYDQVETRLSLYEALFDLCLTKNSKISPPLSVSIGLFRNSINDQAQSIQDFAKNSLYFLRAFTCPLQPIYSKEFIIESKQESTRMESQAPDLILPSLNGGLKQNFETERNENQQSEIDQFVSKQQQSLNAIEIEMEQGLDQSKDTSGQQTNKRKFNYEDEDDINEPENENAYNPKSIAKKFQPNGHFHKRGILNGRDVENSNGDDEEDEEDLEEEVISLNDQEEEEENIEEDSEEEVDEDDEDEEEEEEEIEEDEELDDLEREGVSEKNEENLPDFQGKNEASNSEHVEQLIEEAVVQQILIEPQQNHDLQNGKDESCIEKSTYPSDKVTEEVKNLLKETGDDYDDDESKDQEAESECKASQATTESDIQSQEVSISMNKLDQEIDKSENDKMTKSLDENNQLVEKQEGNIIDKVSKNVEEESKIEENEDFDENKFKQMCASLNVNAMSESN